MCKDASKKSKIIINNTLACEVEEALKNWCYALFFDYYNIPGNNFLCIERSIKEDEIYLTVSQGENKHKFKTSNFRKTIIWVEDDFLCDWYLFLDDKWLHLELSMEMEQMLKKRFPVEPWEN